MNIFDEVRSIQALSKSKQRTLAVFIATVLFWWGMMTFAPTNPLTFWSFIPVVAALLYMSHAYPAPKKNEQGEHEEQGDRE